MGPQMNGFEKIALLATNRQSVKNLVSSISKLLKNKIMDVNPLLTQRIDENHQIEIGGASWDPTEVSIRRRTITRNQEDLAHTVLANCHCML